MLGADAPFRMMGLMLLGAAAAALLLATLLTSLAVLPFLLLAGGAVALGMVVGAATRQGAAAQPAPAPGTAEDPAALALGLAAVLIRTGDGTIRYWSPGAERLFGHPERGAVGRRAHELLRTRFAEGGRRAAEAELRRTGRWHGELRHRRQDGTVVTVASTWSLTQAAGETLIIEASTEATALKTTEEQLRASEGRLRLAQEVAEIGTWEWHPDSDEQDWSREQHALFGTDPDGDAPPSVERLIALAHADDRAALRAVIARAVETGEYEAEFRIQRRGRDGAEETRWIIGRGRRMPGPAGGRGVMLGMHVDITARKQAEMRQLLLIREVDHRAKNALAVVQAVLRLTRAPDQQGFVRAVEGRVAALARAQTLLANSRWSGADLRALLDGELAPFLTSGPLGPGVTLEGPPVLLAPVITQPVSMIIHELATNAVKHGALSTAGGQVAVRWSLADRAGTWLDLLWQEAGGPSLAGPPSCLGFGSRVLQTVVQDQLGGRIAMEWKADGLRCIIQVPLPDVGAGPATTAP
jgi:PAS domain S-box-containing protein